MEENIQTTNTAGEAGLNTQNTDALVQKATEILNAITTKNEKNEKSIINDNIKQFSDEEGAILRELINAQKNKAQEEAKAAAKAKDDLIAKLQKEVGDYKQKERHELLSKNLSTIYEELGIVDDGSKKQAYKLATTGVDMASFFREDGTVDSEKIKKAIEDVLTDVPSLAKKKVVIKETKYDETDEAVEKQKEKILNRWGLNKK